MKNWSVDEKQLQKNPEKYQIWRLEQLINFGLDDEKLDKAQLIRYWPQLRVNIDPYKKRFLEYLLWKKAYSLPDNLTFWNYKNRFSKNEAKKLEKDILSE